MVVTYGDFTCFLSYMFARAEEAELTAVLSDTLIFVYLCCHIFIFLSFHFMYANSVPMLFLCILKKYLFRVLSIIIMCSIF